MARATLLTRFVVLAYAVLLAGNAAPAGFYSRLAMPIWDVMGASPRALHLSSPDGTSHVSARYYERNDGEVWLTTSGRIGSGKVLIGAGVGAEILWSPDAKAFAVTTSDAGANGPYRTMIVATGKHGVVVRDLSPLVHSAFGHPVKCGWPEYPNVGAIKWEPGSARLIVAAEIVAHSNCDSMGTFRAYEVDWRSMKIIRSFDQLTAKRLFEASLGAELRGAPDECIRYPRRCWVSTNHVSHGKD